MEIQVLSRGNISAEINDPGDGNAGVSNSSAGSPKSVLIEQSMKPSTEWQ
jgi:hypothetical protein